MRDTKIGNTWYRIEDGTLLVCGPSDTAWREATPDEAAEAAGIRS